MLVFADSSFLNYFTRCFCCRIFLRDSIFLPRLTAYEWQTNNLANKPSTYSYLLCCHTLKAAPAGLLVTFCSFLQVLFDSQSLFMFDKWNLDFFKIFFSSSFKSDVFEVESKSSFKNVPEGRFWEEHAKRVWPITSAQRKEDLVAEIAGQIVVTWWW